MRLTQELPATTVGTARHPGTAHSAARAGNGGNRGARAICPAVRPCPVSRVRQLKHTPARLSGRGAPARPGTPSGPAGDARLAVTAPGSPGPSQPRPGTPDPASRPAGRPALSMTPARHGRVRAGRHRWPPQAQLPARSQGHPGLLTRAGHRHRPRPAAGPDPDANTPAIEFALACPRMSWASSRHRLHLAGSTRTHAAA